jgi:uncharacterized protein (TIGR02147 family)
MPAKSRPDIFQYTDFRAYLREAYLEGKSRNAGFSHRYISMRMGTRSSGWFSDVVERRMGLKPKHIRPLASLFSLNEAEGEYLRLMVDLDQSGSLDAKTEALRKIMTFRGARAEAVGAGQFEFYGEWYHSALRELLLIHPFTGDFESLAKALDPAIPVKHARKSLLLMARLGLVSRTQAGRWVPKSAVVVKDPSLKSLHWARIQKAFLELALASLERHGKQERDFSALTLNLSPENFRKAGEEVAALRKRLLALSQRDAGNNRVYQCNFQIFPLSRPVEENP